MRAASVGRPSPRQARIAAADAERQRTFAAMEERQRARRARLTAEQVRTDARLAAQREEKERERVHVRANAVARGRGRQRIFAAMQAREERKKAETLAAINAKEETAARNLSGKYDHLQKQREDAIMRKEEIAEARERQVRAARAACVLH